MVLWVGRWALFPRFACAALPHAGDELDRLHRMWLRTEQGDVESWLVLGDGVTAERPGPVVVFAHGNAELIEYWPEQLAPYLRMGVSLYLPEYRGYGRSAGAPSERAITSDFVRFHDMLVERPEVDASRIVYHGRSLGGGAVCQLAARRPPAALVLMSTFTSVAELARRWLVPRRLWLDPFESLPVVRELGVPTLIVHGRNDSLIPVAHAEALHRAAPGSRLVLYDAEHNDCPPDWVPFWIELESFLRDAGVISAGPSART
jgi:hypothetical protein